MHRTYENEDITVFWDSEKCRHARKCVEGNPNVFDINRRPWIDLSKAATAGIWQVIEGCPTGALTCIYNHDIKVAFDEDNMRSAAYDNNRKIGECDYQATPDGWVIYHTEVDLEYSSKGIAKRLVYKITEEAERRKIPVIPTCSYAVKVLHRS